MGSHAGEADQELADAFARSVDEGEHRLRRSGPALLATGAVGGIDVTFGVFALFIVEAATGSRLLSALAFGIGFIALTLAKSELFIENFLVPIATVVAGRGRPPAVLRLWAGTAMMNLLAGWVMTWMEQSAESEVARLLAAIAAAFLLAAAPLNHVIVASLEMFAALHSGATFGYGTWAVTAAWYALGNVVGGVGLVTVLRLVQVGEARIRDEQSESAGAGPDPAE